MDAKEVLQQIYKPGTSVYYRGNRRAWVLNADMSGTGYDVKLRVLDGPFSHRFMKMEDIPALWGDIHRPGWTSHWHPAATHGDIQRAVSVWTNRTAPMPDDGQGGA